ncbi:alpha/beta fold hydrolase [Herbiconiux daphne]|uniref:BD-FAE-like domain-containing protein n=1 Tax=Herbiconiux daphne TaxID=2970914 RepID=A0ABT2H3G9_9MICO|nr:alpha/beta fold hydrolase [Herbiconiux daphne]MCS5734441.1 hypothetical protein [Herbiconiux daphne]
MSGDILDRVARAPELTVAYGPSALQVADLYAAAPDGAGAADTVAAPDAAGAADSAGAPGAASRGFVVLLHGGFWRNRYDRLHLRPLAAALADRGLTVALPEYRRVGDAGGGHPGTFDDVLLAISSLPGLVVDALGPGALGGQTSLVGHSAGGHLAVWSQAVGAKADGDAGAEVGGAGAEGGARSVAASGAAPTPSSARRRGAVDRVVSLAGVLDLGSAHDLALSGGAVGELLDVAAPGFDERLAAADPMRLPVPVSRGVATVVLHGDDDPDVPAAFSSRYAARDDRVILNRLAGVGHFELIDPETAAFDALTAALGVPAHG